MISPVLLTERFDLIWDSQFLAKPQNINITKYSCHKQISRIQTGKNKNQLLFFFFFKYKCVYIDKILNGYIKSIYKYVNQLLSTVTSITKMKILLTFNYH